MGTLFSGVRGRVILGNSARSKSQRQLSRWRVVAHQDAYFLALLQQLPGDHAADNPRSTDYHNHPYSLRGLLTSSGSFLLANLSR